MSNLRWKLVTIIVVTVVFAAVGVYPIVAARWGLTGPKVLTERQLKLGLDLKGGVNLVLRVQTDDALRIEAETEMERLRELLSTARINTTNIAIAGTNAFKVEGSAPDQDSAFRTSANEVSATSRPRFGRQRHLHLHAEAEYRDAAARRGGDAARETIERRVNELGVAEPSIAQQGANGDQILGIAAGCDRRQPCQGDHPFHGSPRLKIVEQGPASTKEQLTPSGTAPSGMGNRPGREQRCGRRFDRLALRCVRPPRSLAATCAARPVARRERPSGRGLHAQL